jgi:hypothetical protein
MIKQKIFLVCLIITGINFSCEKISETDVRNVVINELMPVNNTTVPDESGKYDDWIELYNISSMAIDISGCYLSDKKSDTPKWRLPDGTIIGGNGFLIIWADKDSTESGLHANFKLSSEGETVIFTERNHSLIDEVKMPPQSLELTYSRNPDGTGPFKWQNPTYNRSNIYTK